MEKERLRALNGLECENISGGLYWPNPEPIFPEPKPKPAPQPKPHPESY